MNYKARQHSTKYKLNRVPLSSIYLFWQLCTSYIWVCYIALLDDVLASSEPHCVFHQVKKVN